MLIIIKIIIDKKNCYNKNIIDKKKAVTIKIFEYLPSGKEIKANWQCKKNSIKD